MVCKRAMQLLAGCGKTQLAHKTSLRYYIKTQSHQDAQKGRPARPQRAKRRGVRFRYVEPLNDARTQLADFFNILLEDTHLSEE
jgi:hypothetical protein